jgi:hypothetical protein
MAILFTLTGFDAVFKIQQLEDALSSFLATTGFELLSADSSSPDGKTILLPEQAVARSSASPWRPGPHVAGWITSSRH